MQIHENFSLKPFNTFGIAVLTKYFAVFETVDQLVELLNNPKLAKKNTPPPLILGGGSNILFTRNFDGWVLKNELKGIELVKEDANFYYIKAAAGEAWHELVLFCLQHNYGGLENLSLIPGNVGASPMQNIGAYGVEIKDVFYELEAFHLQEKKLVTFQLSDCQFGYRESVFKRALKGKFVITSVTFQLPKNPVLQTSYGAIEQQLTKMGITNPTIKDVSNAVMHIRSSKLPDPKKVGNAGSFFKNPQIEVSEFDRLQTLYPTIAHYKVNTTTYKIPAAWLIEQCGWKGYRKNDVGCNPLQPLVLVNYGNATGKEIIDLSEEIIRSIHERFGILLEKEVNIY